MDVSDDESKIDSNESMALPIGYVRGLDVDDNSETKREHTNTKNTVLMDRKREKRGTHSKLSRSPIDLLQSSTNNGFYLLRTLETLDLSPSAQRAVTNTDELERVSKAVTEDVRSDSKGVTEDVCSDSDFGVFFFAEPLLTKILQFSDYQTTLSLDICLKGARTRNCIENSHWRAFFRRDFHPNAYHRAQKKKDEETQELWHKY